LLSIRSRDKEKEMTVRTLRQTGVAFLAAILLTATLIQVIASIRIGNTTPAPATTTVVEPVESHTVEPEVHKLTMDVSDLTPSRVWVSANGEVVHKCYNQWGTTFVHEALFNQAGVSAKISWCDRISLYNDIVFNGPDKPTHQRDHHQCVCIPSLFTWDEWSGSVTEKYNSPDKAIKLDWYSYKTTGDFHSTLFPWQHIYPWVKLKVEPYGQVKLTGSDELKWGNGMPE
jgi:hypothetical protein